MRYGFVTFEDVEAADKVVYYLIENLDGSRVSLKIFYLRFTLWCKPKKRYFNLT